MLELLNEYLIEVALIVIPVLLILDTIIKGLAGTLRFISAWYHLYNSID